VTPAPGPTVARGLVRAHGIAALVTLLISVSFGLVAAFQLQSPDFGAGTPALGWGRIRYAHTQGIMLGWLANAFFAFLYQLGLVLFGLWNFVVMLPGWALVLAGVSQPLEWAEFPLLVDVFVVLAFVLAAVQFLPPFFRKGLTDLYVSGWYIIGALVFTLLHHTAASINPYHWLFVIGLALMAVVLMPPTRMLAWARRRWPIALGARR